MPLSLAIIRGNGSDSLNAGMPENFVVSVTNSGSSSVTLQNLMVSESTGTVRVGPVSFLLPGQPYTTAYPTISAGATVFYPFQCTFYVPNYAGPSPQAPGGAAGSSGAMPISASFILQVQSQSSDSTVASAQTMVAVASAIAPFPLATGGGLQLQQGFNLVNFITQFC